MGTTAVLVHMCSGADKSKPCDTPPFAEAVPLKLPSLSARRWTMRDPHVLQNQQCTVLPDKAGRLQCVSFASRSGTSGKRKSAAYTADTPCTELLWRWHSVQWQKKTTG